MGLGRASPDLVPHQRAARARLRPPDEWQAADRISQLHADHAAVCVSPAVRRGPALELVGRDAGARELHGLDGDLGFPVVSVQPGLWLAALPAGPDLVA